MIDYATKGALFVSSATENQYKFYFYNDIGNLDAEPHQYRAAYVDDLCTTQEIYWRQIFYLTSMKYANDHLLRFFHRYSIYSK